MWTNQQAANLSVICVICVCVIVCLFGGRGMGDYLHAVQSGHGSKACLLIHGKLPQINSLLLLTPAPFHRDLLHPPRWTDWGGRCFKGFAGLGQLGKRHLQWNRQRQALFSIYLGLWHSLRLNVWFFSQGLCFGLNFVRKVFSWLIPDCDFLLVHPPKVLI